MPRNNPEGIPRVALKDFLEESLMISREELIKETQEKPWSNP